MQQSPLVPSRNCNGEHLQKGKNAMTTYHPQTGKFVAVIAQNLPQDIASDVMQGWIDNPKALQKVLRSALCPPTEIAESEAPRVTEIKVWKRIMIGTGLKTVDDFRGALKVNDLRIGDGASDILGKPTFTVAERATEVDLVRMLVFDLGFNTSTDYDQICDRAKELGLELCPAEIGPQLRLQYLDQPKNERLVIAMEAIRGSDGDLRVFGVGRGGRGLEDYPGYPGSVCYAGDEFVFVFRKALVS